MDLQKHVGLKLAKRLKDLRKIRNLTQEQLAEQSEISVKHVQRLESSAPCGVRLVTLYQLAKAFRLSLSDFLNFDQNYSSSKIVYSKASEKIPKNKLKP